jgi:glycyl-tRNA synthetase
VDDGALATEDGTTGAGEGTSSSKVKAVPVHYSMDDIVSLCKRRGIIFPSSEIYNGYAGFYDYGPLGCEIKRNVKDLWWKEFVTGREDVVGVDSSIIHNPATWKSSGA